MSLKLKRGEVSAVVGEDGPALDTVLDGPLLSAGPEDKPQKKNERFHDDRKRNRCDTHTKEVGRSEI